MPKSVKELQRESSDCGGEESVLQAKLRPIEQRKREAVAELQELLGKGGTTDDRIMDMVIRAHGMEKLDELMEKYRALEEQLKGKKGELILILFDVIDRSFRIHDGPSGRRMNLVFHLYRLGILAGDTLVYELLGGPLIHLGEDEITIPTTHYIEGQVEALRHGQNLPRREQKNIFARETFGRKREDPPLLREYMAVELGHQTFLDSRLPRTRLTGIIAGNDAVREWFDKQGEDLLNPLRRILVGEAPYPQKIEHCPPINPSSASTAEKIL